MDLAEPPRRRRAEPIVAMINVVFLLLIFFLMTSRLTQPDPFDVTPPAATAAAAPEADPVLFIDAAGRMHYDGAEGGAAIARLADANADSPHVQLRADARLEAQTLARILRQLAAAGLVRAELVVRQP